MWPLWRCGRAALRPCSYGGPNNNLLPLLRFVFGSTFGVVRKRLQIFLYTYLYTNIEKSKYYLRNCKILYSLVISVLCYYMKLPEIRWAIPHSPQRLAKKARQACLNASFLVSFAKPAAGGHIYLHLKNQYAATAIRSLFYDDLGCPVFRHCSRSRGRRVYPPALHSGWCRWSTFWRCFPSGRH